ncbi:MAG TPA: biopolymer transporter ExbD [Longimicrobiales bacterium]|nr:biopolymer transporter ExbD [Longimicrobiales bacterium]
MRGFRRSRRNAIHVNAEINITNLVDVAFVLLIIFMITAPILQGGIELDLPEANAAPLEAKETVIVSISRDGRIYIGDTEVSEGEFRQVFPIRLPSKDDPVFVKGDGDAAYRHPLRIMGTLMDMGYRKVNLVVDPVQAGG